MDKKMELKQEILTLYDDIAIFADQCSFLCRAFGDIVSNSELVDKETARGLELHAGWIKITLLEIKEEIRQLHEKSKEI